VHYPARKARTHRPHEGGRPASSPTRISRRTVGWGVVLSVATTLVTLSLEQMRRARRTAMTNRSHNAMPAAALANELRCSNMRPVRRGATLHGTSTTSQARSSQN
jgi:hypothetical protein